jgi:rubredoxin
MSREYVCKNCGYSGKPKKQFWAWFIIGWAWTYFLLDEDRECPECHQLSMRSVDQYGLSN